MSLQQLLHQRRDEILRLAARFGARRVLVFGSVARGEDDDQSDIDLLVDLAPGRSLFDLGGLQFELEALLGRRVDVVTRPALRPAARARIIEQAVPL